MADEADPPVAEPEAPVDPVETAAPAEAEAEAPSAAEAPAEAEAAVEAEAAAESAPAEPAAAAESAAAGEPAAAGESVAPVEDAGSAEAHVDDPSGPVLADPACVAWVKERVRCQGLTPEMWSAEHDDTLGESTPGSPRAPLPRPPAASPC